MPQVRIAVAQMDIHWEDRDANYQTVRDFARQAKIGGASILVLPEMFATGFSMNPLVTGESPSGKTVSFLCELASQMNLHLIGGYVKEAAGGKGVNSAIAVDSSGTIVGEYAKVHLFRFGGEDKVHLAGQGPVLLSLGGLRTVCFICYDLRFPELFRQVAKDVDAVFVIASWPSSRQSHWDTLLPARAVENQCYVIGANRVGKGGGLFFEGGSAVVDPMGNTLCRAEKTSELLFADLDTRMVEDVRARMPFLQDMRLPV